MTARAELLTEVRAFAAQRGLNLLGLVDAKRFDQSQPCDARSAAWLSGCGTLLVLGSGGRGAGELATRCGPYEIAALLQAHGV